MDNNSREINTLLSCGSEYKLSHSTYKTVLKPCIIFNTFNIWQILLKK